VAEKNAWVPHEVEILARNPDEVAIKGISEGTKVALVEPDASGSPAGTSEKGAQPAAGGKKK
jgi:hypothetical protein